MPREKGAQGQVHNMPHWVISSFEDYSQKLSKLAVVEVKSWESSEKMLKVDVRDVARERLFHHILL